MARFDADVRPAAPPNAEATDLRAWLTPAEARFVRCHFAVPHVPADAPLTVGGRTFAAAELRAMPSHTVTVTTECAGNDRASLEPPVPGEQWKGGAVSTAQWTGVPLRALVEAAGLSDTFVELLFVPHDGPFLRSLPRSTALDPDVLVAWEMNGAPIPAPFGGPLRLIVPGWYGMASVKWLARVEPLATPFEGEFQTQRYVYAPGAPVTRMRPKAMLVEAGRTLLRGMAWAAGGVARVQIEVDGVAQDAELRGPALPHAWRPFELRWSLAPGRHEVRCRAVALDGESQPDAPEWNALGYGANGVRTVIVDLD